MALNLFYDTDSFSLMMQIDLIEVYVFKEKNCFELFAQVPFIHEQYINMFYGVPKVGLP